MRNYYSFIAIIDGLWNYSITSSTLNRDEGTVVPKFVLPQDLFYLNNPFRNFAAYRGQFDRQPGVPFLIPHVTEAKGSLEGEQKFLLELFQKVANTMTH